MSIKNQNLTQKKEKEDSPTKLYKNKYIFKKYKIYQKITGGALGNIYSVVDNQNKLYALKTERNDSKIHLLKQEGFNLLHLKGFGIPELITFGKTNNYTLLIEQYLGKSLLLLLFYHRDKLSLKDKCLLSIQLLDRIEYLHSKTLIHRDIKPQNFLLGIDDPNVIYLTEFRFCSKYKSSKTGRHIKPGFKGTFTGTLRFSSANAQRGMQQSRRDDLESLGYTILLFFKRELPWDYGEKYDWNMSEKDLYLKIFGYKKFYPVDKLCKGCPKELEQYFKYVKGLKFEEEPNYNLLRNIFLEMLKSENIIVNNMDINNMAFSWALQTKDNSKPKSKKKSGIKSRLYHKFLEQFQNKNNGKGIENNITRVNNSVDKIESNQNIIKKTLDNIPNYNEYPKDIRNQTNQINVIDNSNNPNYSSRNYVKKVLIKNQNGKYSYLNEKVPNTNLSLTNRENIDNSLKLQTKKLQTHTKSNMVMKEGNYINNKPNTKIYNYMKIYNTRATNNTKRVNKLNLSNPNNNLSVNISNNNFNIYKQVFKNNIHLNNSKNVKPIPDNINNNIQRYFTKTNIEDKYKQLPMGNKNILYKSNINYNRIFKNTNPNQINQQNNNFSPINRYQTYSNEGNNINRNTTNNISNRNIVYSS